MMYPREVSNRFCQTVCVCVYWEEKEGPKPEESRRASRKGSEEVTCSSSNKRLNGRAESGHDLTSRIHAPNSCVKEGNDVSHGAFFTPTEMLQQIPQHSSFSQPPCHCHSST